MPGNVVNKYGVKDTHKKNKKIPCRCNVRSCQARKTFAKYPEEYETWPKCHVVGCTGTMYVDKFRLQARFNKEKYKSDRGEPCNCIGFPFKHIKGQKTELYTCIHYEEVLIEKSLTKGTFKHSPLKQKDLIDDIEEECPF